MKFNMGQLLDAIDCSLARIRKRGPGGLDMDEIVLVLGELVEVAKHLADVEGVLGIESALTQAHREARS